MEKKSDDNRQISREPTRSYIESATKAAIHPVRSKILKALKEGEKSTLDLEEVTRRARHDLYHHLKVLEDANLIEWKFDRKGIKHYSRKSLQNPQAAVVVLEENDIREKQKDFDALVDLLSDIEGEKIPHRDRITRVEIYLYYGPSPGDHVPQEPDPSGQEKK